jgi:hypothetical protein
VVVAICMHEHSAEATTVTTVTLGLLFLLQHIDQSFVLVLSSLAAHVALPEILHIVISHDEPIIGHPTLWP